MSGRGPLMPQPSLPLRALEESPLGGSMALLLHTSSTLVLGIIDEVYVLDN